MCGYYNVPSPSTALLFAVQHCTVVPTPHLPNACNPEHNCLGRKQKIIQKVVFTLRKFFDLRCFEPKES